MILDIDTTGWARGCGIPGCRWVLDPNHPDCPEHRDDRVRVAETDEEVANVKRGTRRTE